VDEFSLDHADFVMANLPERSRHGRPLTPATRRQVAQVMGRLMNLAVYPGRYRKESPIPKGWLPKPGAAKAKECLYPDEDARLLAGRSVQPGKPGVPLLRRLAYGFLDREGMRTSEMSALRWRDVDLERGRVTLDENKTDDPRDWDLRPDVVEALKRWRARHQPSAQPGDHVFTEDGVPPERRTAGRTVAVRPRTGRHRPAAALRAPRRAPAAPRPRLAGHVRDDRARDRQDRDLGHGSHWAHRKRDGKSLPPEGAVVETGGARTARRVHP